MPELPEVETVVRQIRNSLVGKKIVSFDCDWPRILGPLLLQEFRAQVIGQSFQKIDRRGKYIVCTLDRHFLLIHLKMTGRLYVAENNFQHHSDRWVHVKWGLENQTDLRFSDARKFGRVSLLNHLEDLENKLGPEPLSAEFTVELFAKNLLRSKKSIKALLLDQSVLAGVGNIYADEALIHAQIHPLTWADQLNLEDFTRLHQAIQKVLQAGIDHEGASINWYRKPDGTQGSSQNHFYAYDRQDQPCRFCGSLIEKIRVVQRGTHYCPKCQKIR